jgi:hypothetical protein
MDPEKNKTPEMVSQKIINRSFSFKKVKTPMNNKNKA